MTRLYKHDPKDDARPLLGNGIPLRDADTGSECRQTSNMPFQAFPFPLS